MNWWPFGSLDQLDTAITAAGRTLYAAHRPLLQRAEALLADPGFDPEEYADRMESRTNGLLITAGTEA
ncbi:hypothetical protein [Streptomyces sp. NPDC057966]|uniref:hypothetical protein n=1 Tax=Streptomyces sp. NPDC057966 TaxID=3346292 RepID=UPI0036F12B98